MSSPRLLSNRYELGDTLGYGGMSEVHAGRDVRLSRDVAVKVLRADLARDHTFQERFRREAQNAAALNHPAIVAVYDTGETKTEYGPLPYIVMEYVDGRTLRDIVKTEGPLAGKRAMEVMADVCAALDFSHRHGIVHRDVKPANVMITRTGAVKVMDFGIARAVADGQAAVTQTAAVIGTAQYLSPEQARGEAVDARSDVYAAGCVLFELLTGEPPFTGDSPVAVAYQHVREDPKSPSQLNHEVTPALDAIVLKAMAKGPANRYQSAAEMRGDLVRVLSGGRPAAPMVMTDADRTSMMTAGRPTETNSGRHRPDAMLDDAYDDEDEDERAARRKRAWVITGVVAACIIVLGLVTWLMTNLLGGSSDGDKVAVPNVVNQTEAAARTTLGNAGFTKVVVSYVACQPADDGTAAPCTQDDYGKVLKIDPAANSQADKFQTITLTVAKAPDQVAVPDLKGKSLEEATAALKAIGLTISADTQQTPADDDSLVNKVVSSNPGAGVQVPKGSQVQITLGTAVEKVTVPDVTNQTQEQATSNLKQYGFAVAVKQTDSDQQQGNVVKQDPDGGTQVKKGSTVTIYVSNGASITMPNIAGMTVQEAQAALQQLGWSGSISTTSQTVDDPRQDGKIQDFNPDANQQLKKNQTVQVVVGSYGPPTSFTIPTPPFGGGGPHR